MKISDEDIVILRELQAKLAEEGIKMSLGKVAAYAVRKVLLK